MEQERKKKVFFFQKKCHILFTKRKRKERKFIYTKIFTYERKEKNKYNAFLNKKYSNF